MKDIRFSRGEYWLLETVVEYEHQVWTIARPDMEEMLNKAGHGLSNNDLLAVLLDLFKSGNIYIRQNNINIGENDKGIIADVLHGKRQSEDIVYGLTSEGARKWEAFAKPRWEYFLVHSTEPIDDEHENTEVICMNKEHLNRYLISLQQHGYLDDKDTIMWDTLIPWDATYWKTIPEAHIIKTTNKMPESHLLPEPTNLFWQQMWYAWG